MSWPAPEVSSSATSSTRIPSLGLNGATVEPAARRPTVTTFATPDDAAQPDGMYILYAHDGSQSLTASLERYTPETSARPSSLHGAVRLDFHLAAGLLDASPRPLSARVDPGRRPRPPSTSPTAAARARTSSSSSSTCRRRSGGGAPAIRRSRVGASGARPGARGRRDARNAAGLAPLPRTPARRPLRSPEATCSMPIRRGWPPAGASPSTRTTATSGSPTPASSAATTSSIDTSTDGTQTGDTIDDASWVGISRPTARSTRGPACSGGSTSAATTASTSSIRSSARPTGQQDLRAAVVRHSRSAGLAYDVRTDTFYAGGWNDGVIYHVDRAGTSSTPPPSRSPSPGSRSTAGRAISSR